MASRSARRGALRRRPQARGLPCPWLSVGSTRPQRMRKISMASRGACRRLHVLRPGHGGTGRVPTDDHRGFGARTRDRTSRRKTGLSRAVMALSRDRARETVDRPGYAVSMRRAADSRSSSSPIPTEQASSRPNGVPSTLRVSIAPCCASAQHACATAAQHRATNSRWRRRKWSGMGGFSGCSRAREGTAGSGHYLFYGKPLRGFVK